MMKWVFVLAIAATASLFPIGANADETTEATLRTSESTRLAGLTWRCRNGDWGTIGNGCLKQRRKAKAKG